MSWGNSQYDENPFAVSYYNTVPEHSFINVSQETTSYAPAEQKQYTPAGISKPDNPPWLQENNTSSQGAGNNWESENQGGVPPSQAETQESPTK